MNIRAVGFAGPNGWVPNSDTFSTPTILIDALMLDLGKVGVGWAPDSDSDILYSDRLNPYKPEAPNSVVCKTFEL